MLSRRPVSRIITACLAACIVVLLVTLSGCALITPTIEKLTGGGKGSNSPTPSAPSTPSAPATPTTSSETSGETTPMEPEDSAPPATLENPVWKAVGNDEMRDLIASGAKVVDVRSARQFASLHIEGAVNVPLEKLVKESAAWDKSEPIAVYCQNGSYSNTAAGWLHRKGFLRVYRLSGGIAKWDGDVTGSAVSRRRNRPIAYFFYIADEDGLAYKPYVDALKKEWEDEVDFRYCNVSTDLVAVDLAKKFMITHSPTLYLVDTDGDALKLAGTSSIRPAWARLNSWFGGKD